MKSENLRRISNNGDPWLHKTPHANASPLGGSDQGVDIKALMHTTGERVLGRLFVINADDGHAGLSSPGHQIISVAAWVHGDESSTGSVVDKGLRTCVLLLSAFEKDGQSHNCVRMVTLSLGQLHLYLAADAELGSVDPGHETNQGVEHLFPGAAHVHRGDVLDHHVVLLEGALGEEEVVDREDGRHGVAQDLGPNVLRGEEACVQSRQNPYSARVASRVSSRELFSI